MSKQPARKKGSPEKRAARPAPPPVRPDISSPSDPFFRKLFAGLAGAVLLLTVVLSLGSGINGDDEYQNDYSARLVRYYSSFGADTAALAVDTMATDLYNRGKMYYYGGFFDLLTGLANQALGYEQADAGYHHVRHVFNALFGFVAMLFTALLVRFVAGWRAAILTLLLMFLSPRFLGHSLMNPKDIPFAAGYMMAVCCMVPFLRQLPRPDLRWAAGVAAGIGIAIGTRAGGLLLVAYLGLFAGLSFLQQYGWSGIFRHARQVGGYAAWTLGVALSGYLLALLCWPYALQSPLAHPLEALGEFSKLGIRIRVLFKGENVMSDQTDWDYALQWVWRTVPLFALAGLAVALLYFRSLWRRYLPLPLLLVCFSGFFPLSYIIYKDSVLHDGWRHLTFVYPPLLAFSVLGLVRLEEQLREKKTARYVLYGAVGLLMLEPAVFIARNTAYPYVYFNPAAGGVGHAFGRYETDYWGLSVRQAVDWLEASGRISPDMQDTVVVGTSFSFLLGTYVAKKYDGKVQVRYQRFNNRYDREWDYGIFPSRYIKGPHLRAGTWPNARTIHTVDANGVPLTAVEQGGGAIFRAEQAFKRQDWQAAIAAYEEELRQYADNEIAWTNLAIAYLNSNDLPAAKNAAEKLLQVAPDNASGLLYRGLAQLNLGDTNAAEADFRQAVAVEADFSTAYYYLALIEKQRRNLSGALSYLQQVLTLAPRFRAAYELAAQIYEEQGDPARAAQFRQAANSM
ncbi:MAG: hypothetical protein RLY31_2421 [Bacteroidota bacterium]|jgi:hypothetical protein